MVPSTVRLMRSELGSILKEVAISILFWYFLEDNKENHKNLGMGMLIFDSDVRHFT
jgi:hypothetical protein